MHMGSHVMFALKNRSRVSTSIFYTHIERDLYPHLFRHTVATDMLRKNTPITDVQKMLGHANVNTTMVYAKTCDEDVKRSHHKSVA